MADTYLQPVVAVLTADIAAYKAAMLEAAASTTGFAESADVSAAAVADAHRGVDDSAGLLASSVGAGTAEVADAEEAMAARGGQAAKDLEGAHDELESHTSSFASHLSSMFSSLAGVMGNIGLPFHESVGKMGDSISEAETQGSGFSASMMSLGKVATVGLAGAFAVAAVEGVHLGDQFASAAGQLSSSAGISIKAATGIGDAFKNINGEASAIELTKAYASVAAQLGTVEGHALTSAQAVQVMSAAGDLADAKLGPLSSTTSDLARVMQAYGLSAGQAGTTSDTLYGISTKTGLGLDQVAQTLQRLHSQLGVATPDLSQVGGMMLDLATHGETGRAAVSAVSTAFTGLLAPTAKVIQAQQQLGVSFINSKGQLDPMSQIIGQLAPKLDGMGNAQAAATLKAIGFGSAGAKVLDVIKAGPAVFDADTKSVTTAGSAHAAAAAQMSTLSGQGEVLKKDLENIGTTLGQWLIPMLADLAGVIASVIGWFERHKTVAEAFGIALGVLIAGPVAAYIASMATAAAATIAATAPIIAVVAAVAALGLGIYWLSTHWTEAWNWIKQTFDEALKFLRSGFGTLIVIFTGPLAPFLLVALHWQQIWAGIKAVAADVWHFLDGIWQAIDSDATAVWEAIVGFFTSTWQTITSAVHTTWDAIGSFFTSVWDGIEHGFGTFLALLITGFRDVADGAFTMVEGILQAASHLPFIGGQFKGLLNDVDNFQTGMDTTLAQVAESMSSWGTTAGQNLGVGMAQGISEAQVTAMTSAQNLAIGTVQALRKAAQMSSPSKLTFQAGIDFAQGLELGIGQGQPGVTAAITHLIDTKALTSFPEIPSQAAAAGAGAGSGSLTLVVEMNGRTVAQELIGDLQTVLLQRGRQVVTLGIS